MVNADSVYKEIEYTIKNVEIIQNCLSQIEQEFTDTNYPNWKFDVDLNGKLFGNPVCYVTGETIEKGLNCSAKIGIQFRCCKKKPTVNIKVAGLRFICLDKEYLQTMNKFISMSNVPFELLRAVCKILDETKYENLVTKGTKELKVELKKFDLNEDFKNG